MRFIKIIFCYLAMCAAIAFISSQADAAEANPCITCHAKLQKPAKSVHAAIALGCSACHKPVEGKTHPGQKGSIVLTQNMPGLCYNCHDESKFKGKSVHQPIPAGMCTGCHDAHQSNYPKVLLKDVPGLCYNCHDESKFKGKSGHTNLGMCTGCHNPHSSESDKILKTTQPELCFTCHEKPKFNKKYVHSIIPAGGCSSCHTPHANNNPSLLINSGVEELCLTCHVGKNDGRHIVSLPDNRIHPIKGKNPSTVKTITVPDPKRPGKEMQIIDPDNPGKDFDCVTCHDPHSSDFRQLFTEQNICGKCHKYY